MKHNFSRLLFIVAFSLMFVGLICHSHRWAGDGGDYLRHLQGGELAHKEKLYSICDQLALIGFGAFVLLVLLNVKEIRKLNDRDCEMGLFLLGVAYLIAVFIYGPIWNYYFHLPGCAQE